MTNFKWLRRTSSSQRDRRTSRQFTPRVGGLEYRIAPGSISGIGAGAFASNDHSFNGSFNDLSTNNGNFTA